MNQMKFVNREPINKGWLSDRKYWAIPFGQDEINTMLNQAKDILRWYDNMRNPVPTWYIAFNVQEKEMNALSVIRHYDVSSIRKLYKSRRADHTESV